MKKTYLPKLEELVALCGSLPKTRMMALARIEALIALNMRYERIQLDRALPDHPYVLVERLVDDALRAIRSWSEVQFVEAADPALDDVDTEVQEAMHQDLFQRLWTQFDLEEYRGRIARFERRLDVNGLSDGFLAGKRCIDFGCGHGNFDHSLSNKGAAFVLGIDYGEDSIAFARRVRDELGAPPQRIEFKHASVYDCGEPDASFDFALQNGVFHHLDDEDRAYREVARVLKPGGWFWVYTDGKGAISMDLWDASRAALGDIPAALIVAHLKYLNVETNKRYHLGDGLNAVYRHETWEGIVARLEALGFANFRRLVGGFPTDFDHDVIEQDPYGPEKFGSGDLRLICQKI